MSVVSPGSSIRRAAPGREFDFLIVGGGVTALCLAALLVSRRLTAAGRVAVMEPAGTARGLAGPAVASQAAGESAWDLRVFALSRASQRLLMTCGAWQLMPHGKLSAYERMCVWDDAQRAGSLTFDCAELGEPNLGFIVEGKALQIACRRAASAAGVVFIEAAAAAVEVGETAVDLLLQDGRSLSCQLLIAADGVDSGTRSLLGIETAGHSYHQLALVAHVRTSLSHRNTAWQRFLPEGPVALLPLPDGRSSIVWTTGRAAAEGLLALDAAAFGAALTAASGEVLGACELTTAVASFPLKLQYAVDYVRPRAVLVGDAAHVVHPLAGQGLNLGLLDCAVLAEVLGEASGADGGRFGEHKLLRRYERRRRADNLLAATALDGLERLFASDNAVLGALRKAGLSAVGRVPFIKRELAMRALGLAGDSPKFLREPM